MVTPGSMLRVTPLFTKRLPVTIYGLFADVQVVSTDIYPDTFVSETQFLLIPTIKTTINTNKQDRLCTFILFFSFFDFYEIRCFILCRIKTGIQISNFLFCTPQSFTLLNRIFIWSGLAPGFTQKSF